MAIPNIHLLCMEEHFSDAFTEARNSWNLPSSVSVQIHNYALSQLPSSTRFDTIVSPANSYGRLDGAFDDAISRALSPRDDYLALTHAAQEKLYEQWRGFAPPGTCTLVRIPDEFRARSRNVWGCRRVALCPTMRIPDDVRWDREVVYECIWSLLCAVGNHNRDVRAGKAGEGEEEIRSILMTPLATGVGRVTAKRWAEQAVLAMSHYVEADANPKKFSKLEWEEFGLHAWETKSTWKE
jgi:O-acetyl-ADP-ribose deacetylase (regulator of RNase III)